MRMKIIYPITAMQAARSFPKGEAIIKNLQILFLNNKMSLGG